MSNEIQRIVDTVACGQHLSRAQMARAMQIIITGGATPAQAAGLLVALRMKGETVDEIAGAAEALRAKMDALPATPPVIDVCGTGGDGLGMLNVSTAVALVLAGCGLRVAKHGNKSVSSRSGSADVLAMLGVNLQAGRALAGRALAEANICFLFAPLYHKAMRHIAPVRQELGMRTIFNLLGPLINPATPGMQLLGVYDRGLVAPMAGVLRGLASRAAWVVHGHDGADELSLTGPSYVAQLRNGEITQFEVTPEEAGLKRCEPDALKGGTPEHNAREMRGMLGGRAGAYRDMVLLNAAAALLIAGRAATLQAGAALAARSIDEGNAAAALTALVRITNLPEGA